MERIPPTEDEILEQIEYENWIEVESLLALIKEKWADPNLFNSFDWANNYRERASDKTIKLLIAELHDEHKPVSEFERGDFDTFRNPIGVEQLEFLERQWKQLGNDNRDNYPNQRTYRVDSPLEKFLIDISYGSYPEPESLVMLAKCFELYLLADGELTLEEVFFGKPRKGSGNYAKRYTKALYFREFHFQVVKEKVHCQLRNEKFNLERFAQAYIELHEDEDVCAVNATSDTIDSYIRSYRRWLKEIPTDK